MGLPKYAVSGNKIKKKVWEFGEPLYDLEITIEDNLFKLHRNRIEPVSEYIHKMVGQDTAFPSVHFGITQLGLQNISPEGFGYICQWIYTENIHIASNNLSIIWAAAKKLQIQGVIKQCETFVGKITKANSPKASTVHQYRKQKDIQKPASVHLPQDTIQLTPSSQVSESESDVSDCRPRNPNQEHRAAQSTNEKSYFISDLDEMNDLTSYKHNLQIHKSLYRAEHLCDDHNSAFKLSKDASDNFLGSEANRITASDNIDTERFHSVCGISNSDFTFLLNTALLPIPNTIQQKITKINCHVPVVHMKSVHPVAVSKAAVWLKNGDCQLNVWEITPLLRLTRILEMQSLFQICLQFMHIFIQSIENELEGNQTIMAEDLSLLYHYMHNMHRYFDHCCIIFESIVQAVSSWDHLPKNVAMRATSVLAPTYIQKMQSTLFPQPFKVTTKNLIKWPIIKNDVQMPQEYDVNHNAEETNKTSTNAQLRDRFRTLVRHPGVLAKNANDGSDKKFNLHSLIKQVTTNSKPKKNNNSVNVHSSANGTRSREKSKLLVKANNGTQQAEPSTKVLMDQEGNSTLRKSSKTLNDNKHPTLTSQGTTSKNVQSNIATAITASSKLMQLHNASRGISIIKKSLNQVNDITTRPPPAPSVVSTIPRAKPGFLVKRS